MPFRRVEGWAWLILSATIAVLAAAGFTVVYVNRVVHQMCGIILLQADVNPPATTERGRALQREASNLAREYNCR